MMDSGDQDLEQIDEEDAQMYSSDEEQCDEVDNGKSIHSLRESLEVNKENLETTAGFYEKPNNFSIGTGVTKRGKILNSSPDRTVTSSTHLQESLPSQDEDVEAEDGEILEDGEIDDDDCDNEDEDANEEMEEEKEKSASQELPISQGAEDENATRPQESEKSAGSENEEGKKADKDNSESESEEDESKEKKKKERKKRKRQRVKEKKKKMKDEVKRKRKKHGYMDYDKAEEDVKFNIKNSKRSPPGPYDSPQDSPGYSPQPKRSPPGPYDSPYRSPPGPYDSPPESPPGPYDSPPEDSEDDERYGDQDGHKRQYKKSMMGMLDDAYLDPNIAVSEKQDLFREPMRGRNRKRGHGMKGMQHQQPRKKPLLETPRAARPLCKFYKEGKCAKGSQCPFNHDFTPPKKPDICKFYLNSTCNKGRDCLYMHEEYPCKFFHTGAKCYQGDACKFSHEPLTEDTQMLLEKILDNNDDDMLIAQPQQKGPRPSLLGSPPRHVKEAAERMKTGKKIPSLFDIEVFPPKQSPKKQQSSGSNSDPLSPTHSQPSTQGRPGFYNETGSPPAQPACNPAVLALGALLNQAVGQHGSSSSLDPRYPYQSPDGQTFPGPDSQHSDSSSRTAKTEFEQEDSQDTQKLEEEDSQDDRVDQSQGGKSEDQTSDEERKVAANFEIPSHLPPRQRELFLRIHQQQKEEAIQGQNPSEAEERVDDDDWYSSDEDESGAPKQKDIFTSLRPSKVTQPPVISQTSVSQTPPGPSLGDSGSGKATFDILQMLNAIRGQGSAPSTGLTASAVQPETIPQQTKTETKSDPRISPGKTPPRRESSDPVEQLPRVPKDGSELPYKVVTITVSKTAYIPPNLNLNDPSVRNDPRIQRYMSQGGPPPKPEKQTSQPASDGESATSKPSKSTDPRAPKSTGPSSDGVSGPSKPVTVQSKPVDPRKARSSQNSEGPTDPRRPSKESASSSNNSSGETVKTIDPRLQRAVTELLQSTVLKPDPRLQKVQSNPVMGMHSLPARPPMGPRFGLGPPRPPGPRGMRPPLLRTPVMHDNNFRPHGPPPFFDPRLGRQNSLDAASMNFADPRIRPQGRSPNTENSNFPPHSNDPRIRPQGMSPNRENSLSFGPAQNDPRVKPQGMSPGRENSIHSGPKPNDPRMKPQGMSPGRDGSINISPKPNDPRVKTQGMSAGSDGSINLAPKPNDPRRRQQDVNAQASKCGDPRLGRRGSAVDVAPSHHASDPRLSRQISQPAMSESVSAEGENSSANSSDDNKLNHRKDPRFKRKTIVDNPSGSGDQKPNSPPAKKKRFIGQRKGSMEYSSPLGMSSDQPDPTVSGFSSYNRPPPNRPQPTNSKVRSNEPGLSGSQHIITGDPRAIRPAGYNSPNQYTGYSSPSHTASQPEDSGTQQILSGLPDQLSNPPPGAPGPPLKELFKTIDPTASPFC